MIDFATYFTSLFLCIVIFFFFMHCRPLLRTEPKHWRKKVEGNMFLKK